MSCAKCGLSLSNSVHHSINQYNYHDYIGFPYEEQIAILESRISDLGSRVDYLERRLLKT